jgi:U3 small nucleolar RNA-associated protein 5
VGAADGADGTAAAAKKRKKKEQANEAAAAAAAADALAVGEDGHLLKRARKEAADSADGSAGAEVAAAAAAADGLLLQDRVQGLIDGATAKSAQAAAEADQLAIPKAGSLKALLEQALHNGDKANVEACLEYTDAKIVSNTVGRLSAPSLLPLLKHLVILFRRKPNRAKALSGWIKALVTHHASYIAALPEAAALLAQLTNAIGHRVQSFKRMLKLSGRLELILSQVAQQQQQLAASGAGGIGMAPQNVYVEESAPAAVLDQQEEARMLMDDSDSESDDSDDSDEDEDEDEDDDEDDDDDEGAY